MMNLLGKRYLFFALSFIIIVPGLIILFTGGIPLSIDFTGGSLLEVTFEGNVPQPAQVLASYKEAGIKDPQVQTTETGGIIIRSEFLNNEKRDAVLTALSEAFGETTVQRFDSVGPSIGEQVTSRAAMAVGVSSLLVVIFIAWSFRGVKGAYRYGISAILAMLHDVALIFSVTAFGSIFLGWEIDSLFLTALLTVIGFSMQDSIVVFDRIRENSSSLRRLDYETLVNHSIVQTLQRSINTQLMTVEFLLLALAFFGGVTLREFVVILLVGLMSGTYSSIFIAAPILVVWENKEWRNWFGRNKAAA
ncbi:MAG: protein translocase subunit SecF [Anaerolineae bacterium]|uniref:Protein-export membrane protein SecF n=1 Tax=Candidatus Desulfolinea nitratireducens TaxID=2841698 RepID=A0A8J6TF07_9CHLR|nr:protein translocase subunit SecF [Candidatus Desulfolinea nitratireducens]MBL6960699.1 protein translocase subunit SecF [Anaerolineales bacterium]NQU29990.1 protein translocase subunit SecF [Anaerolineae bacterium]